MFSEQFQGAGLADDVEFSCRAGRLGSLWVLPFVHLCHEAEQSNRPDGQLAAFRAVRNRWEVLRAMQGNHSGVRFWLSVLVSEMSFIRSWIRADYRQRKGRVLVAHIVGTVAGSWAVLAGKPIR